MENEYREVYILTLEHWSGSIIRIIGAYEDLEEAKRVQREFDLNRQGISLYATEIHPAAKKNTRKGRAKNGNV